MRGATILGVLILSASAGAQPVRLTPLTTIGCESCDGPLLLTRVQAVAIAPDRRILVADRTAPHVRIFDATGRPVAAFGRRGQGPGELGTPMAISVAPNGNIEVIDMSRRRLTRFGPAGEDRGSVPVGGFATAGAFAPQGGHGVAVVSAARAPVLELIRVSGDKPVPLLDVKDSDFPLRPPGHIETLSVAVAPDGSFVVGDGVGAYLLRRYNADGTPAGEFGRTIAKLRRTPAEIRAESDRRGKQMAAFAERVGGRAPAPTFTVPPERNFFDAYGLQFDEKGRLWVRAERGKPDETVFDLFDPKGTFLGEVVVPARIRDFSLGAGLLAAPVQNDDGVPQVRVWRVEGG